MVLSFGCLSSLISLAIPPFIIIVSLLRIKLLSSTINTNQTHDIGTLVYAKVYKHGYIILMEKIVSI